MRKKILLEFGWMIGVFLLCILQTGLLVNWNSGKSLNIITLTIAVLTIISKKRAIEIAFLAGVLMDAFSATPFGLHLIEYLLLILLMTLLTNNVFHASVLYTVGLSTILGTIIASVFFETVGSLVLFHSGSVLLVPATLLTIFWQGVLHGILITVSLWLWQRRPQVVKNFYGV